MTFWLRLIANKQRSFQNIQMPISRLTVWLTGDWWPVTVDYWPGNRLIGSKQGTLIILYIGYYEREAVK